TDPRSSVSPSKFQLVLQISKSLSSVAALVCLITWYVQVRLTLEAQYRRASSNSCCR
ncbi:hypothetical protein J6590_101022, partial [Homalodisca vitripennis]